MDFNSYNYTKISKTAKDNMDKFLSGLCTKQHLYEYIDEFLCAMPDGKGYIERKIVKKLTACDERTKYLSLCGNRPLCRDKTDQKEVQLAAERYKKLANRLIDKSELDNAFFCYFESIRSSYKNSGDYMTRLVKERLYEINPSIIKDGDSTRLLLLKQYLCACEFPKDAFLDKAFVSYINGVCKLCGKESQEQIQSAIQNLDEGVFDILLSVREDLSAVKRPYDEFIPHCEEARDELRHKNAQLKALPQQLKKQIKETKNAFKEKQKSEKNAACAEFSKAKEKYAKDISSCSDAEKAKALKSSLVALEKQHKSDLFALEKAITEQENSAITSLKEECANTQATLLLQAKELAQKTSQLEKELAKLKDAYRQKQKSYNRIYEPLNWATELASGFFAEQRTTRLKLYKFAIIFDMTFYSGSVYETEDENTDLQTKLFYEYYADNMLNCLENPLSGSEKEPSGYGINFKNFAEAIYLYYIRKPELSALEKLCEAQRKIELCAKKAAVSAKDLQNQKASWEEQLKSNEQMRRFDALQNEGTIFYRQKASELFECPEHNLVSFITNNYICSNSSNPLHVNDNANTATKIHLMLVDKIHSLVLERTIADTKTAVEQKKSAAEILKSYSLLFENTPKDLNDSTKALFSRMSEKFAVIEKKKTFDEVISSSFMPSKQSSIQSVTRTKILVACYYIYMLSDPEEYVTKSFDDFYEDFCDNCEFYLQKRDSTGKEIASESYFGVNSILEECSFQQINTKNIFDAALLFFSYKEFCK